MANPGWRFDSARHALAAQGVRTGRRYNFNLAQFKFGGFARRMGRMNEDASTYGRFLRPQMQVAQMPVEGGAVLQTVAPASGGLASGMRVTAPTGWVGRRAAPVTGAVVAVAPMQQVSVTDYQELRGIGRSMKAINKHISAAREKLNHISGKKSYGARAPPIIESVRQSEAQLQSMYAQYTPETIQKAYAAAPKDY